MHVAFVDSAPLTFGGGYECFIVDAAKYGTRHGHRVSIITPPTRVALIPYLAASFGRIRQQTDTESLRRAVAPATIHATWLRTARKLSAGAEVIYGKNEPQDLAFMSYLMKFSTVPFVVGFHSSIERRGGFSAPLRNGLYRSRLYRRLLDKAEHVHVLQESQLRDVSMLTSKGISLIPNGVNVDTFQPRLDGIFRLEGPLRILFAGRLDLQKGFDIFCEMVDRLNGQGISAGIEFSVAGDGPFRRMAKERAGKWPNVTWLGHCQDIATVYRRHHLLVAPSRWEMFSLVPAEALASGVPVILSDIPASEPFASSPSTFLVPLSAYELSSTVANLEQKWRGVDNSYRTLAVAARRFAVEHLDSQVRHDQIYTMLEGVRRK